MAGGDDAMPVSAWPARALLLALLWIAAGPAAATDATADARARIEGHWVFNPGASDDVDKKVAKALRKAGSRIELPKGVGRNDYARFRGGPEEQELYDHLAYDREFSLRREGDDYQLVHFHEGEFRRRASTTQRTRVVSASGSTRDDDSDHSFAYWDGDILMIDTRPRDGGFALEQYRLLDNGQLEVFLRLEPLKFPAALTFIRVFDRAPGSPDR